jgi:hypothetical protein
MKTQPNKNAKLSEAIRIGSKIAKENGIKHTTGRIFSRDSINGEVLCACAVGLALLGKYGVENIAKRPHPSNFSGTFHRVFGTKKIFAEKEQCLIKTVCKSKKLHVRGARLSKSIYEFIYRLNDLAELKPNAIAEKLEKCGL